MSTCQAGNDYDGQIGARISSIFVILVGSFLGAWFPVFSRRHSAVGLPEWAFFCAKYFGSGVIIATAFIHLLAPASDALTDPCLTGPITEYDWAEGIALMTIFVLFFLELMTMRYAKFGPDDDGHGHGHVHEHGHSHSPVESGSNFTDDIPERTLPLNAKTPHDYNLETLRSPSHTTSHMPGEDHHGHAREHTHNDTVSTDWEQRPHAIIPEAYSAQMTAIFILEFGVIFHSVFVGLTLAVAGSEFKTLYVVLVFHQTFEGLGLGSRLASIPWPKRKRWTPYILAAAYGVTTPIAIAIGLGVRKSYPPNSSTTLIVNGVFDSISAGILIYTGLVELMAHEFMFSPEMSKAPIKQVLAAFGLMCLGAALMALLGKWA